MKTLTTRMATSSEQVLALLESATALLEDKNNEADLKAKPGKPPMQIEIRYSRTKKGK